MSSKPRCEPLQGVSLLMGVPAVHPTSTRHAVPSKAWTTEPRYVRPSLQWSYSDLYTDPAGTPNFGRFTFLDSAAQRFYPDWNLAADMLVANLRTAAGKDPHDKGLHDLVGELSTRSDDFRRRWAATDAVASSSARPR